MTVAITQVDHGEDASTASTYTFTSRAFGATASDRRIIVGLSTRVAGTTTTVSSVTIGGVSATQVVSAPNNTGGNTTLAELWVADVPSGTTGDVVVTFSGSVLRCGINVWRMVGTSAGAAASATGSSLVDPGTATLTIPANGSAVGYAVADLASGGSPNIVWTNLTVGLAHTTIIATFEHSAAAADFSTGGSTALTADYSAGSVDDPSAAFAAWAPAAAGGGTLFSRARMDAGFGKPGYGL